MKARLITLGITLVVFAAFVAPIAQAGGRVP